MKKNLMRIISVVLVMAMLIAVAPTSVFAAEPEKGELKISVMTDVHMYAKENIDDMDECTKVCEATMKTSHISEDIVDTTLDFFADKAEKEGMDYLFIPGDLTKDGDINSHKALAAKLEAWEKETGVDVLVVNGNHDINNSNAQYFRNGKFVKDSSLITNAQQFKEIYKNLGWDFAIDEYEPPKGKEAGALSYVAELKNGYRLVVLDGGKYSPDSTESGEYEHETAGAYTPDLLEWAVDKTEENKAAGYTVLGMTHFNIVPHLGGKELSALTAFCIEDCEYVSERLADAGMNYVFTGHIHVHDIGSHVSDKGNIIYDICTASLINSPNMVRRITFDNTGAETVIADVQSHSFDELEPLVSNGVTYEQPFRNTCFGINFAGDSVHTMVMDLVEHYLDEYLPEIQEKGGLYNFLNDMLDLGGLISGLLGDGVKFAGITIIGSKNAMGLIKDLCAQLDKAYVSDREGLLELVSGLLDDLLGIQVSDVPCTKFLDTYGFGDSTRGGNLGDLVASVLAYMYGVGDTLEDDAFMCDVLETLETGEITDILIDELISTLLDDFIMGELLGTLELNITSAFPFGTFGSGIVRVLDLVLRVVLWGDTSFSNIIDFVFGLLQKLGVWNYSSVNDILTHIMDEYLTQSQLETVDGEIANFLKDFCMDDGPQDVDPTLEANINGGYEVEATQDNLRLPSNVSVTFGKDASNSRIISWFTKQGVTGTDIQLALDPNFENPASNNIKIDKSTELVRRQFPGIDIGIMGILTYEFNVNRHIVKLAGLEAGRTYYYRIGDAKAGFWSKTATITTADNSDSFTFFHVSDCQGGMARHYESWKNVLSTAFAMYPDASFLMHTGDHVDHGDNFNQWKWMFNYGSDYLMSSVLMPTAGNHEEKGTNAITNNFVLADYPEQDTEEGVYYSFDYNNAHFIVLNSNNLNKDEGLSDDQIAWLKADAAASDAEWKVVSLHKGVYTNGSHFDDDDVIAIRAQLATLMPELDIDLVLQGHDHVYLRTDAMNQNQEVEVYEMSVSNNGKQYTAKVNPDGTIYVIDGCSGVKFYQTKDETETDALFPRAEKIFDATMPVFSAIQIKGNTLYFNAYGVTDNGTVDIDSFAIVKDASIDTPKFEGNKKNPLASIFGKAA